MLHEGARRDVGAGGGGLVKFNCPHVNNKQPLAFSHRGFFKKPEVLILKIF